MIACGFEAVGALLRGKRVEELGDGTPEALKGSLGRLAQQRCQLGKGVLRGPQPIPDRLGCPAIGLKSGEEGGR